MVYIFLVKCDQYVTELLIYLKIYFKDFEIKCLHQLFQV